MNIFTRIFLVCIAFFGVGSLGYYAYVLAAETLSYPFIGTESQRGDTIEMVVERPKFIMNFIGGPVIDQEALEDALMIQEKPLKSVVSGEYSVTVSGEYIRVTVPNLAQDEQVRLDVDRYNDTKSTRYRLPKDITLTALETPRSLTIESLGDPKDQTYTVSMFGFGEYTPEHIRYYISHDREVSCSIETDWSRFAPIFPSENSPILRDGQIYTTKVRFQYDASEPYTCILGGVNGVYTTVEDRFLEPFTVTGSLIDILSPEYDMQSRVEFQFSHPIYTDTGALYSPEYIAHRRDAKIDFLKHFSVSPDLPLTPDNVVLSPDRAIITLPLVEGQAVKFSLDTIEDIYGRSTDTDFATVPKQEPFLSLKLASDRLYYRPDEPIGVKLYALKSPKSTYSMKICQLPLETYARAERLLSEDFTRSSLDSFYTILDGKDAFSCAKKDIDLTGSGYVSNFSAAAIMNRENLSPGMYMMTFASKDDILGFPKAVRPLIFTVMDSHVTMKVDSSGKMMFFVTDLLTGKPLSDQEITLMRNITRTYEESWNSTTNETERTYLPFSTQAFATGIVIGRTNKEGFLDTKLDGLEGIDEYESSPYGLSFESWWEYEGRYESFLVQSRSGDGRLGFLTSTWNDGITGYNFGMKEYDYSYENRPRYTAYLHTDRRLYLPGETVHIHGILRENSSSLQIPRDIAYTLIVSDSMGKEVSRVDMKPNEFGTISTDYILPKEASLGNYSVSLMTLDQTEYVQNGWTNFQVEIFKNPTFTATVELRSPDLDGEVLKNLRKKPNTDPNSPWYSDVYEGQLSLEGIVKAKYYNGTEIKNAPFTYRVYRSSYYDPGYWGDCFWGCYYEPPLEFYTEGTGSIDNDGFGVFRAGIDYQSYWDDYQYTVEVTLKDPLTDEEVTTPSSLVVRFPEAYKTFAYDNPLIFAPKKKILQNGEILAGTLKPQYGSWDQSLSGKYRYEIIQKIYTDTPVDDIRAGTIQVTTLTEKIIASDDIQDDEFSTKLIGYPPGEYMMRVSPKIQTGSTLPDSAISETSFYIAGSSLDMRGSALRVITEKLVYKPGETARILVTVPFTGATILLTLEKGGVLKRETFTLSGNTFTREYKVDDTLIPNAYVSVVALNPRGGLENRRTYAVGYSEIIADATEKKANLSVKTDKSTYKNREKVSADITLTDRSGNPLEGEIAVMVIDESLIRLMGNIDLDITPKFYQKYPFTMKTALSLIGIERNRWLSRKGSNGGSGDKGGGGVEIASRTLFKNTAYYNPSIRTDPSGKAKFSFDLPDNVTDYRIIAIANTRASHFGISETPISVRKDYVLETVTPMIVRPGDSSNITVSAFNTTSTITRASLEIFIGTGSSVVKKTSDLILNPKESVAKTFDFEVQGTWSGTIPYRVDLRQDKILLDSYTGNFRHAPIPLIESSSRQVILFSGTTLSVPLPQAASGTDMASSRVDISISTNYASQLTAAIKSLVQYPYGCIEQTIGSTLPNALALKFSETVGIEIDRPLAQLNAEKGLEKILRMQYYDGGWVYWEGSDQSESHITPYVLRSLLLFRELGYTIPESVFDAGSAYIINMLPSYRENVDSLTEAIWTLALLGRTPEALEAWKSIDPKSLSRHGYLIYAYTADELGLTIDGLDRELDLRMFGTGYTSSYWYWDEYADKGIYSQYLIDQGQSEKAFALLDRVVRETDLTSYYVSTQAKIQIFRALLKQSLENEKLTQSVPMAFRSDALIADVTLSPTKSSVTIDTTREKVGSSFSLKRESAKSPLYIIVTTRDRTKSILDMPPKSAGGMGIVRTFELIDETKGVDSDGDFVARKAVTDGTFEVGRLYRVTLKAFLPTDENSSWDNLAIEDYYPGGWRPINSRFKTTSATTRSTSSDWWSYIESRDDRMLSHVENGYGKTRTSTYYIRPNIAGNYLLPPASAYYMYRPEVHAYTRYEKIRVVNK